MNRAKRAYALYLARRLGVGALLLCLLLGCLCSCQKDEPEEEAVLTAIDYDVVEDWSEYVLLSQYTGLEICLQQEADSKSEQVWKTVLGQAEILHYPEEQVSYYAAQTRATYRYYAQQNGWSLEETMEKLGVTEESILAEARDMVKGDLVYRYIVADAGIALTEEEKASLFDRYARQYAETYGYELSYVTASLSELVYDSMLYDKTMEYLIVNNTFVVSAEEIS
ncbi:MAG: hypothetical protein IJY47_08000 [Clostridia bacterium]|nr:hypothetical protein [Clostridia bacterium]